MLNASLGPETLVYFERLSDHHLILAPNTQCPAPWGYIRCEARTAREAEKFSRRFYAQIKRRFHAVDEQFATRLEARMKQVRDRLLQKQATTTSQYERDFIREALKKLEDGERAIRQRKLEGCLAIEATEAPRG